MFQPVLGGRRIAPGASPGRKVRTPSGAMLRNPSLFDWDTRRRPVGRLADGKCHRKSNRRRLFEAARVKRWCKRPPRGAQATRHGKPHRVQGQIGNPEAARSARRESAAGFGYRSLRQMILSAARRRQNSAYSPFKTILIDDCRVKRGGGRSIANRKQRGSGRFLPFHFLRALRADRQ